MKQNNDTINGQVAHKHLGRRDLFKSGGLAALGGILGGGASEAATGPRVPLTTYETLGVEPVINCWGTMTVLGGSLMEPEVMAAMKAANSAYIYMPELIEGAGKRLSELTGAEWGCVTGGAASAIWAVTAACVVGDDPQKKKQLPDTSGLKSEAIIPKAHMLGYFDAACRMVGLKLNTPDTKEEMEAVISKRTAIVYIVGEHARPGFPNHGNLGYRDIIAVAKKHGVPVLVDAAAEEPDAPNYYLETGADLVCYSGGKCLRGPQSAGIVLGRKDLCMAAAKNLSPYEGIGRTQKVGKEEIMGVLTALELWLHGRDHDAEYKEWERVLTYIAKRVMQIDTVKTKIVKPGRPSNVAPTMSITWDQNVVKITPDELDDKLMSGYPRIKIASYTGDSEHRRTAAIMPYQMRPGDEIPVARRIHEILSEAAR